MPSDTGVIRCPPCTDVRNRQELWMACPWVDHAAVFSGSALVFAEDVVECAGPGAELRSSAGVILGVEH